MKKYKKLIILVLIVFPSVFLNSQDIHFSQFYFTPQLHNPASTGDFNGEWRINNIFRSQWNSIAPYNTFSIAGDKQFRFRGKKISTGAVILHDRSGGGMLVNSSLYLGGAYEFNFGGHKLRPGIQLGAKYSTLSDAYLGVDNTDGEFTNPYIADNDPVSFDANLGLKYSKQMGIFEPNIGVAIHHIFSTNQSMVNDNYIDPMRVSANVGGDIDVAESFYLTPNFLYMSKANTSDIVYGSNFTYVISKSYLEKSIFAGAYQRMNDALIFLVGANWLNWTAGISYDANTSQLSSVSNSPGGFEISLIYRDISSQIQKIFIPCDRF